jgi:hypothetical protein
MAPLAGIGRKQAPGKDAGSRRYSRNPTRFIRVQMFCRFTPALSEYADEI